MDANVTTNPALIVHLFRHAETRYKLPDGRRSYDIPNPELTDAGRSQCSEQRQAIRELRPHIQRIFCSPLHRAIETGLLLFEESINREFPLELLAELQCFGVEPSQLGDEIEDLRRIHGDKVILDRLPEGYNDPEVKAVADWDEEDNRRELLFNLMMELWDSNGCSRNFEIVFMTHSSVIKNVFHLDISSTNDGFSTFVWKSDPENLCSISTEELSKLREEHGTNSPRPTPSHE